jgi:hypothetical protein
VKKKILIVGVLLWFSGSIVQGQDPTSTVTVTQDGLAHPGGLGKVRVAIDHTLSDGILGASIPILFDTTRLTAISSFPIGELALVNGGAGPDYFNWSPRDQGMLVGFITELIPPAANLQASGDSFEVVFFIEPTEAGQTVPLLVLGIPQQSPPLGYDVILQLPGGATFEAPVSQVTSALVVDDQLPFLRGDANANGERDLVDVIHILEFLFLSTPPSCEAAIDANGSGATNITDAILLLDHLFVTGTPLSDPFADCGGDQVGLPCATTNCP